MEKKKRYLLNCEVCDARKMHENLFDPYDEVVINADVLLVNEDARRNLSRYPIQLNGDNIVEAEGDVDRCRREKQCWWSTEDLPFHRARRNF